MNLNKSAFLFNSIESFELPQLSLCESFKEDSNSLERNKENPLHFNSLYGTISTSAIEKYNNLKKDIKQCLTNLESSDIITTSKTSLYLKAEGEIDKIFKNYWSFTSSRIPQLRGLLDSLYAMEKTSDQTKGFLLECEYAYQKILKEIKLPEIEVNMKKNYTEKCERKYNENIIFVEKKIQTDDKAQDLDIKHRIKKINDHLDELEKCSAIDELTIVKIEQLKSSKDIK